MPYWRLFYHLVWATKNREPLINDVEQRVISRSFKLTFADLGIQPQAVGFMPDHVHVVIAIPPSVSVSEAVKRLKGAPSRAMREGPNEHFEWQREYGALTVGERALPQVIDYVRHQRERHADGHVYAALERITETESLKGTSVV